MKVSLARSLVRRADSELVAMHDCWIGGVPPARRPELLRALRSSMRDPTAAAAVRSRLEASAARLLEALLNAPPRGLDLEELRRQVGEVCPPGALRAALAELAAAGLAVSRLAEGNSGGAMETWAVPMEVARALASVAEECSDPAGLVTLHGFLERHFRRSEGREQAAEHARRMYRLLAAEAAICDRLDGLGAATRETVARVINTWGGLVPIAELSKVQLPIDVARLRRELEGASLGTVGQLDLERFGIRQRGLVLALFNETVLASLRRSARERPVAPRYTASIGVDFVSNFSRFAAFVGDQNVRFTVRGTIFKSTGKRIADSLIPNPGREFRRREILELEYRFALAYRLIDRTGERSFMLTRAGQEFLRVPLMEQQRAMLDWLIEDRTLPGDLAHQLRLRRIALRYLKRLEPSVWYDAMFLPFLVRNHYLATLAAENREAAEPSSFPVRSSADLQSLAWNLFLWVRKHLYLLGIIEMGYDESGRACALRLTPMGAELLGMIPGRELEGAGHLVVNPDFEIVLFPEERSHRLVYQLDRFCERERSDRLYHYRITPASLHRALQQGLNLDEILRLLRERSRTPLPQNVVYSLESWARNGGMVTLYGDGRMTCDSPDVLDRLQIHPEIERVGVDRTDAGTLRLRRPVSSEKLAGWVRDFGICLREAS